MHDGTKKDLPAMHSVFGKTAFITRLPRLRDVEIRLIDNDDNR